MRFRTNPIPIILALITACAGGGEIHRDAATGSPDTGAVSRAAPPMTAMPMLPGLRAHLDSVAARPAMLKDGMSGHRAEVMGVIEAMRADIMAAGMHSDAHYEALADSVVKGSAALGTASGREFDRLVVEHIDQMRRLASVYESMAKAK